MVGEVLDSHEPRARFYEELNVKTRMEGGDEVQRLIHSIPEAYKLTDYDRSVLDLCRDSLVEGKEAVAVAALSAWFAEKVGYGGQHIHTCFWFNKWMRHFRHCGQVYPQLPSQDLIEAEFTACHYEEQAK